MNPIRLEVSAKDVILTRGKRKIMIPLKQACEIALTIAVKVDPNHPEKFVRVY